MVDKQGRERTDTDGILKDLVSGDCALAPLGGAGADMGGYKGYGWATATELLCTAFQKGPWGADICGIDRETGKPKPMPLGHYFLAVDVASLSGDLEGFKKSASALLADLRASRKDPTGPGRIWTAGEVEWDARQQRGGGRAAHSFAETPGGAGGCPCPPPLQKDLKELRDTLPGMKEKYAQLPFE